MGTIALVEASVFDEPVVAKLLRPGIASDPEAVARFRRELESHERLSGRLQVPRLVPLLEACTAEDPRKVHGLFPYYPDGTLADHLDGSAPKSSALWILADAVEGLQSLHGHGYVHRDIHPSNIFVQREGGRLRGVLGDLGVGVFLEQNTVISRREIEDEERFSVGHLGYIDPCSQTVPAADFYAVGATLYRIFVGEDSSPDSAPLQLPALPGQGGGQEEDVWARAAQVVEQLTAADLRKRLRSAREVRDAIVDLAEACEASEASRTRSPSGTRRWWIAAGLAALVLLAAGGVLVMGGSQWEGPSDSTVRKSEDDQAIGREPTPTAPALGAADEPTRERGSDGPEEDGSIGRDTKGDRPEERVAARSVEPAPVREILAVEERLRRGEMDLARDALVQLHERYPGDSEVATRLGLLLLREGRVREAEAVLDSALAADPLRGDIRLLLARVISQQQRVSEARALLSRAPPATSHAEEIERLDETLAAESDRGG